MEKIGDMEFYTLDEVEDEIIGKKGTSRRDAYEAKVKEELDAIRMGEAIKRARLERNMTQTELGELLGVKRAQVSRIEKGRNLTLATIARVFRALGVSASLELTGIGKINLW